MVGLDLQLNIISYAVVSAKFEASKSLLDSFLPLVEHALLCIDANYVEEIKINDSYEDMYGYRIHSAILSQLLKSLQHQGKIERLKGESIQIYKEKLRTYESKSQYEKNLRELISDINIFFKRKGYEAKKDDISKSVIDFLRKNAVDFNAFINYNTDFDDYSEDNSLQKELIEFFIEERRNNTKHYEFIKEIYTGIVLSSIIVSGEETASTFDETFYIENVLLDSNYIFRLLDLQTSLEFQAARDTYEALKDSGCKFWVCRETLKQIAETIRAILSNCNENTNAVLRLYGEDRFTGLASACIRRSLTAAKLEEIIYGIEEVLIKDFSVNIIDENQYNIDCVNKNSEHFKSLSEKKPDSSDFGILHDLLLIHVVAHSRPKALYKTDQAKWWVLTDDNKLTRWNAKNAGTAVPECITEAQLATVMWLCNPKTSSLDGLFNTIVALRSQGLAGNHEYNKISAEIERQRKRVSTDPTKLKKLPLVFSYRLLSLSDMLEEDCNVADARVDQLLEEAEERDSAREKLIEEKDKSLAEQLEKAEVLSAQVSDTKSLLSKTKEQLIESLKSRIGDKQKQIDANDASINKYETAILKREKHAKFFICFGIWIALLFLLPLIDDMFGQWYNEHQLVVTLGWTGFSLVLSCAGFKVDFLSALSKGLVSILVKISAMKNYEKEKNFLAENNEKLFEEIGAIQDEIDKELDL